MAPGLHFSEDVPVIRPLSAALAAVATWLAASTAAASPLARAAALRAVHAKGSLGDREVALSDPRPLEVGEILTRHGVTSDVELREVTPFRDDGKPVSGLGRLLAPRRTVALAPETDGEVALLADRKGVKAPAASRHPTLRYAWKTVRESRLGKAAMVADGLMYTGLAATALFAPHLLAAAAIANVAESAGEKTAYGLAFWRDKPKIAAQHQAVGEVASFVKGEAAAGRTVPFSEAYARYRKAIDGQAAVKPSERLDAFQLRDWLTQALEH